MSKTGAAKVMTAAGPIWCHFSQSNATIKLRRYCERDIIEIAGDILVFVPLDECKKLVGVKSYSYKNVEVWRKILRRLENGGPPSNKEDRKTSKKEPIVVPITMLRQFYDSLKLFDKHTIKNLASSFAANPSSLEHFWTQSRETFEAYRNEEGWSLRANDNLPEAPSNLTSVSDTNKFTAYVTKKKKGVLEEYSYVEREINPWRTQAAIYSNKLPATNSGAGGMDILFKSEKTTFPVVGEVKARNDKNAFFALIQAMTYAVELSTPSQLQRLKKHFKDKFRDLDLENAKVEILLLMVNHTKDDTLDSVSKLIKDINKSGSWPGLGQIVLLWNEGERWKRHS